LEKDRCKNTDHQSRNRVGIISKELTSRATRHDLGSRAEQLKTNEEEVKEETNKKNTKGNHTPLVATVAAAGLENFVPGGVADLLGNIEVRVTKMNGSCRALFA
jgi:hypothetical protein